MLKVLCFLFGLVSWGCLALPTFAEFKQKYGYSYPTKEEDAMREKIYQQNIKKLEENPCEWCGVTKFYAYTQAEIDGTAPSLSPARPPPPARHSRAGLEAT